jgi:hypothetical protein
MQTAGKGHKLGPRWRSAEVELVRVGAEVGKDDLLDLEPEVGLVGACRLVRDPPLRSHRGASLLAETVVIHLGRLVRQTLGGIQTELDHIGVVGSGRVHPQCQGFVQIVVNLGPQTQKSPVDDAVLGNKLDHDSRRRVKGGHEGTQ